jgi:hypothetical protein
MHITRQDLSTKYWLEDLKRIDQVGDLGEYVRAVFN